MGALRKAVQVLKLLAERGRLWSLSEISRELAISKSTLHGLLRTLEEEGFLVRDSVSKRYGLGPALFELARRGLKAYPLREVARTAMARLAERCSETVFLGVRNGHRVTVLEVAESPADLKVTSPVGTSLPLLAGAVGKVFLSRMQEEEVMALLCEGLPSYTPYSITDPRAYLEELQRVRQEGVAYDDEEYLQGIRAVAAPLETPFPPPAALWIVGFAASLTREKMEQLASLLRETAQEISRALKDLP